MMKRLLTIVFLITITVSYTEAQLLEDTDKKLKKARVERRGFLFFRSKKKVKNSDGIPSGSKKSSVRYSNASSPFEFIKRISPRYSAPKDKVKRYSVGVRYSSGNPFKRNKYKRVTRNSAGNPFRGSSYKRSPRYSGGNPFRGSDYKVTPRYSGGNPFRGQDYKRDVRYSPGNPFKGNKYRVTPRYSPGNPFRGNDYKVSPRYSQGNPFRGSRYKVSPRYSPGNPFRGNRYKVSPRYSGGMPFRGKDYKVTPRYSQGNPFRGMKYKVSPRYSKGMPFRGKDYHVNPRYSEASPFRGKEKVSPRYTGTKLGFFKMVRNRKLAIAHYYWESSQWEGDMKVNRKTYGDQHPSSNYHFAMKFQNPEVRKLLRKWNVFWTRLNGNKQNSKGVKERVKEPKFDKKERVIWNK